MECVIATYIQRTYSSRAVKYTTPQLLRLLALDQLKIIDFNVSKYFGTSYDYLEVEELDSSLVKMLTITGNKLYSAPEMLKGGGYKYMIKRGTLILILC